MIRLLSIYFLLVLCLPSWAQEIDYNTPIPSNKQLKRGKLPNGMTYYIYPTDVIKDRASYYIIQNVGSILENDDQQGLAHFLEHMAFNGTEHFEGKGILNTLQKHGAVFGKDINAYTSFDETVYNINNIPNSEGLVDTCLLVLHDWANGLLLTEKEIDAERGVIAEERRTRENGQLRLLTKSLASLTNGSKYAERMPIGDTSIVANFKYKILRDFYHDWYRTDLQAIAVIGDIDAEEIEKKIKDQFSNIPAVSNPKKRNLINIPENEKLIFHIGMDDEVANAVISLSIRHNRSFETLTANDYKKSLLRQMSVEMLNDRLNEIQQKPSAPFLYSAVSFGDSYPKTIKAFNTTIVPKANMQKEAFELVMKEVNRAVKFGFTKGEIDRKKLPYLTYYENQLKKINELPHEYLADAIKNEYLVNEQMTDLADEFQVLKNIFNEVSPKDFHQAIQAMYTQKNRTLNLTGVKGNKNMTEAAVLSILESVENDPSLEAYKEDLEGLSLMGDRKLKSGKIISEKEIEEIEATSFELSNGVKVYYKFIDKEKNDIRLNAFSYGGESLISNEDYPSLDLLDWLIQTSGLGDYNTNDLKKILAGKKANSTISINPISEGIQASSSIKDLETLFQLVNLQLTAPRFDEQSYEVIQNTIPQILAHQTTDIKAKINNRTIEAIYGKNNPRKSIFNQAHVDKISFEQIKKIYQERFGNVSDFEFFVVGDISKEVLKPLLEKYIASIPSKTTKKENYKDNKAKWLKPTIKATIPMEMKNPKGKVNIHFEKELDYSLANYYKTRILADLLRLRYTESLREEEGGTYGASVQGSLSKRPKSIAEISINFDCNPSMVDKMVAIVHEEIAKIKSGEILEDDLQKTLTNYLKEREEAKDKNWYYRSLLQNYVRESYNMNDPKNFEDIISKIQKQDIKKFTKRLFENPDSYEIVIIPEEKNK